MFILKPVEEESMLTAHTILLFPGKFLIGTKHQDPKGVVINDQSLSRSHCEISTESLTTPSTVTDLKSKYGTFVDSRKITEPTPLILNSNLHLGIYNTKYQVNSFDFQISFSGIKQKDRLILHCQTKGIKVAKDLRDSTVLVMEKITITCKLLSALCYGIYVVSPQWLYDMNFAWLDPTSYLPPFENKNWNAISFIPVPSRSKIFDRRVFVLNKAQVEAVGEAITAGGGKVFANNCSCVACTCDTLSKKKFRMEDYCNCRNETCALQHLYVLDSRVEKLKKYLIFQESIAKAILFNDFLKNCVYDQSSTNVLLERNVSRLQSRVLLDATKSLTFNAKEVPLPKSVDLEEVSMLPSVRENKSMLAPSSSNNQLSSLSELKKNLQTQSGGNSRSDRFKSQLQPTNTQLDFPKSDTLSVVEKPTKSDDMDIFDLFIPESTAEPKVSNQPSASAQPPSLSNPRNTSLTIQSEGFKEPKTDKLKQMNESELKIDSPKQSLPKEDAMDDFFDTLMDMGEPVPYSHPVQEEPMQVEEVEEEPIKIKEEIIIPPTPKNQRTVDVEEDPDVVPSTLPRTVKFEAPAPTQAPAAEKDDENDDETGAICVKLVPLCKKQKPILNHASQSSSLPNYKRFRSKVRVVNKFISVLPASMITASCSDSDAEVEPRPTPKKAKPFIDLDFEM